MRIKTRIRRIKIYIGTVYERLTPFFNVLRSFSSTFVCGSDVHYTGYNYAFSEQELSKKCQYTWNHFLWLLIVRKKPVADDYRYMGTDNGEKNKIIFTRWIFTKNQCYKAILDFKKITSKNVKWKYNKYLLKHIQTLSNFNN